MKRILVTAAVAAASLVAVGAEAQLRLPTPPRPDYTKVQEHSTGLGHGLYMITGAGGNTTLAVGRDGLIAVDSQFAPVYAKLKAKIAEISPLPVKYLINTHYHGDHTGGNADFARDGATIVAQVNVVKRLKNPPPGPTGTPGTPAVPAAIPTRTYTTRLTLSIPGQTAQLMHFPAAHTDGDTVVYWPAANVISTGDIVRSGGYPNIDVAVGGSIDGLISGTDAILKLINDDTRVIPGHGQLTNKAGVRAYRDMLVTARRLIAKEIAEGKTVQQTVADHPLAAFDAKWGAAGPAYAERFPVVVYESLKKSGVKARSGD